MNNLKNMTFELSSSNVKYREILKGKYLELEIEAISDANPNVNGSHFRYEGMKTAVKRGDFQNTPILGYFKDGDFVSHEGQYGYDEDLDQDYWDTTNGERILGWIREKDPVQIVEKNGLHWITFTCVLCIRYCYKQAKKLLQDKNKKVSVEVTVNTWEENEDTGIMDIVDLETA